MEVERNNGYGGMKKMTLHRIICLWTEELNSWIRTSVPTENRKKKEKKNNPKIWE